MNSNENNFIKNVNDKIYLATKHYQKQYKFEIGTGQHDTWNNEADAFKHTFGSAYMGIKYTIPFSKIAGDIHEKQNPNNPKGEENMDKWNNRVGRLIAKEIKKTGIDDAIKNFGHSTVIETVLDNPDLKHMRPQLATIIKGYDLNSLKELAQSCSTSSFVYICSIVNKEFVEELKDERKDLCYSARKQVENMEKQYA